MAELVHGIRHGQTLAVGSNFKLQQPAPPGSNIFSVTESPDPQDEANSIGQEAGFYQASNALYFKDTQVVS